jgi:hypothetical protein
MNKLSFQKVAKKKEKKQPLHLCQRHSIGAKEIFKKFLKALFFFNLEVLYIFFFLGQANDNQKACQH